LTIIYPVAWGVITGCTNTIHGYVVTS
jgi:hypothetical protein